MAPLVSVPARCLHHVPTSLIFEKAALTEPCCVAYNAVCVNSRVQPGNTIAVIGPGPIGLLCAMLAKLSGAGHIIVIGIPGDAKRLGIAKQIGADTILGAQGEDVVEWVKNFGDGYGLDLVIDAAGVSASLKLALDIVRPAGQITKVGWGPQPINFSLGSFRTEGGHLTGSYSHTGRFGKRSFPPGYWQDRFDLYSTESRLSTSGTRLLKKCTPAQSSKECSSRDPTLILTPSVDGKR